MKRKGTKNHAKSDVIKNHDLRNQEKEGFKEKAEYEKCVCCKKVTDIPVNLHVELRPFYIQGAGQLCRNCYKALYH